MKESDVRNEHDINLLNSFAAGSVGGICFLIVGYPFDTIKVRMQTMPHPPPGQSPLYTNTYDCARKIFIKEGPLGFFKGMAVPLVFMSFLDSIYFGGFNLGKKLQQPDPNIPCTNIQIALAGGLAGVFTTSFLGPGERIKCLLQVQLNNSGESVVGGRRRYTGPVDVVRQLYHEDGVRSLFRGTGATLLREVPASAVFFLTYTLAKKALAPSDPNKKGELSVGRTLLAGGIAGIADWLVAMPTDVLKSRLQTAPKGKYRGIRHVLIDLLHTDGPLALYRGFTPVMMRAFPANAACFLGYELAIKFLNRSFHD